MGTVTRMELRKISELHPYEHNAKLHPPEQIEKLRRSFREFGMIVPVGIDGQDRVIYGHGRLLAAQAEGWAEVPTVTITDLTEDQRRAFIHADNLLGETGYDKDVLRSEAQALRAAGFDVTLVGFEAAGIKLETVEAQLEDVTEDDAGEVPKEPRTKRGELWQLGDHVLMCGDSSRKEDLSKLLDTSTPPNLVFTDPPYGVSIGDKNKTLHEHGFGGGITENIIGDTLSPEELYKILVQAFTNLRELCSDDCSYYVSSPQGGELGLMMMMMMKDAGLAVRHMLIWVKNCATFSLGRLDYDYRHEPIFYTWTKSHKWYGDYCNTVIDDSKPIDKMDKAELKELLRAKMYPSEQSVIYCDKPNASKLHPTMKPVKLVARFILNSSAKGDTVADIFGGSGTTLMACEQLGRKCRMMEMDPGYCDVIIARWEAFTGREAVRIDG